MESRESLMRRLDSIYEVSGLCHAVGRLMDWDDSKCRHDFGFTRAALARFAPDVDANAVISIIEQLGARCDCEFGLNVCAEV